MEFRVRSNLKVSIFKRLLWG